MSPDLNLDTSSCMETQEFLQTFVSLQRMSVVSAPVSSVAITLLF